MSRLRTDDTIVAPATAPGASPAAILRLSGPQAHSITLSCFEPDAPHDRFDRDRAVMRRGRLRIPLPTGPDAAGTVPSRVPALCVLYRAPRSYTGEETAEILLPGAAPLVQAALEAFVHAGARPAERGEFTFRAFRGGRMNLGQAEAVGRLATAGTDSLRAEALARLDNASPPAAATLREELVSLAAELEAALDFEEPETDPDAAPVLAARAEALANRCREALPRSGPVPASEGVPVLLLGPAGAGKSALVNALLGREAVLVGEDRPMTRDSLRLPLRIHGEALLLVDTPGLVPDSVPESVVPPDGRAGVVCLVLDGSAPLAPPDPGLRTLLAEGSHLMLLAKADLPAAYPDEAAAAWGAEAGLAGGTPLRVSARTGAGLAELRRLLARTAAGCALEAEGTLSAREAARLREAEAGLRRSAAILRGDADYLLAAEELREARAALGRALGQDSPEEVLEAVFARFCIGK